MYQSADINKCIETAAAGENSVTDNVWSNWGEWTGCSKSCDGGVQTRIRKCMYNKSKSKCKGEPIEHRECNTFTCPYWADWMEWQSGQGSILFRAKNFA